MTITTERQQFAEQNGMTMEFVDWFFDKKKDGCGAMWFTMAAAMWEGWKGKELLSAREEVPVVRLPTTRLWAGVVECYSKSDVISAMHAAGVEVSDD